jgi:hypothetical protein
MPIDVWAKLDEPGSEEVDPVCKYVFCFGL